MFSRFDRIPACDRRTDRQTDRRTDGPTSCHGIVFAMHARRAVKTSRRRLCRDEAVSTMQYNTPKGSSPQSYMSVYDGLRITLKERKLTINSSINETEN